MRVIKKLALLSLSAAVFAGMMCWSGEIRPSTPGELFAQAEARVGVPATPVSYAGVARRTTRRVVYPAAAATTAAAATAAAATAAAAHPTTTVVVATPATCTEVVDTTGKVVKPCP